MQQGYTDGRPLTRDECIERGICAKCRRVKARPNRLFCVACSRADNIRQRRYRDCERCPACKQVIRRCTICGGRDHRADNHDAFERKKASAGGRNLPKRDGRAGSSVMHARK